MSNAPSIRTTGTRRARRRLRALSSTSPPTRTGRARRRSARTRAAGVAQRQSRPAGEVALGRRPVAARGSGVRARRASPPAGGARARRSSPGSRTRHVWPPRSGPRQSSPSSVASSQRWTLILAGRRRSPRRSSRSPSSGLVSGPSAIDRLVEDRERPVLAAAIEAEVRAGACATSARSARRTAAAASRRPRSGSGGPSCASSRRAAASAPRSGRGRRRRRRGRALRARKASLAARGSCAWTGPAARATSAGWRIGGRTLQELRRGPQPRQPGGVEAPRRQLDPCDEPPGSERSIARPSRRFTRSSPATFRWP